MKFVSRSRGCLAGPYGGPRDASPARPACPCTAPGMPSHFLPAPPYPSPGMPSHFLPAPPYPSPGMPSHFLPAPPSTLASRQTGVYPAGPGRPSRAGPVRRAMGPGGGRRGDGSSKRQGIPTGLGGIYSRGVCGYIDLGWMCVYIYIHRSGDADGTPSRTGESGVTCPHRGRPRLTANRRARELASHVSTPHRGPVANWRPDHHVSALAPSPLPDRPPPSPGPPTGLPTRPLARAPGPDAAPQPAPGRQVGAGDPSRLGSEPLSRGLPDAGGHRATAAPPRGPRSGPPPARPRALRPPGTRHPTALAAISLAGSGPVRLYTYSPAPLGGPGVVQSLRVGNVNLRDGVCYGGGPCVVRFPIQSGPLF